MIISDLAHLEVVREDNQIVGGVQISGSSSSVSGLATTGSVSVNDSSLSSTSSFPDVFFTSPFGFVSVGTETTTSANASSGGSGSSGSIIII